MIETIVNIVAIVAYALMVVGVLMLLVLLGLERLLPPVPIRRKHDSRERDAR